MKCEMWIGSKIASYLNQFCILHFVEIRMIEKHEKKKKRRRSKLRNANKYHKKK